MLGDPSQPETTYGVSKAFGEVLGRYCPDHHGLESVAIRIGWLLPYDGPELRISESKRRIWLSPRDGVAALPAGDAAGAACANGGRAALG